MMTEFTVADVAGHKTRDDLWVIIHGKGTSRTYLLCQ